MIRDLHWMKDFMRVMKFWMIHMAMSKLQQVLKMREGDSLKYYKMYLVIRFTLKTTRKTSTSWYIKA